MNLSRQFATPGHVVYAYNKGQRCLSLPVWLLGVDYVSCTSCTAGSKGHRLLGSLLWGDATTSIFWGVGPSFHAFNESKPPWVGPFTARQCTVCSLVYCTHTNRYSSALGTWAVFHTSRMRRLYTSQNEHFAYTYV